MFTLKLKLLQQKCLKHKTSATIIIAATIVSKLLLLTVFNHDEHPSSNTLSSIVRSPKQSGSNNLRSSSSASSSWREHLASSTLVDHPQHSQHAAGGPHGHVVLSQWVVGNLTQKGLVEGTKQLIGTSTQLYADRRTAWTLAVTPWFCYWCCMLYFFVCLFVAPVYIHYTRPLSKCAVQPLEISLNAVMLAMYAYITYEFIVNMWHSGIDDLLCSPPPQPDTRAFTPREYRLARACYWYYISKLVRLLDTLIFLLRHKRSSMNTAHVLHHGLMPALAFILVRFYPGGHTVFGPMVHSCVHVWLYAYFLLSSLGPKYERFLFWKKWLTQLQLAHFFLMLGHELLSHAIGCRIWKTYLYDMMYSIFGLMIVKYIYVYMISYIIVPKKNSIKN